MYPKVIFTRTADRGPALPLPTYAHHGDSGMDLRADVDVVLLPGDHAVVPTGLRAAIPAGYEGQVRPRSGLAAKYGVTVLNAPGTVDSGFRGEVCVVLVNHGRAEWGCARGERIAQLVIAPVARVECSLVTSLDDTERGTGGFGSSGNK